MERKLGILAECTAYENSIDMLDYIKQCGFEAIFSQHNEYDYVEKLSNKCSKLGLDIDFLHSPFHGINNLWLQGDDYLTLYKGIKQSFDVAKQNDIPAVIVHVASGWEPPKVCDIGLKRFDDLVEYSKKTGVIIAFENLRKVGHIAMLVDRYEKEDNVKFCYDFGHEHCYTPKICIPDIFKERIACVHIHDNYGFDYDNPTHNGDIHLLPFDGNVDYQKDIQKLDEYGFIGTLMLEVSKEKYASLSNEEFISEAYNRGKRLQKLSK